MASNFAWQSDPPEPPVPVVLEVDAPSGPAVLEEAVAVDEAELAAPPAPDALPEA